MTFQKSSTFFSTKLYADDTSLTASGSDLESLLHEIKNHLPAVYKWLYYDTNFGKLVYKIKS